MRLILLLCLLILTAASPARAVVIDFTVNFGTVFDPGDTYEEDGFTLSIVSGDTWAILDGFRFGNPPPAFFVGQGDAVGLGDTATLTKTDGGEFTLNSFEFYSGNGVDGLPSDGIDIVGLNGGVIVDQSLGFSTSATTVQTFGGFSSLIDEVQFIGASAGDAGLTIDNIVLDEVVVPLPPTGFLLLASLACLGFRFKRRSST
ncbi:MAG: hypothetical protein AAGC81_11495 [Pseudomonadota bacterium]